jgi:hypothetical protein
MQTSDVRGVLTQRAPGDRWLFRRRSVRAQSIEAGVARLWRRLPNWISARPNSSAGVAVMRRYLSAPEAPGGY